MSTNKEDCCKTFIKLTPDSHESSEVAGVVNMLHSNSGNGRISYPVALSIMFLW